MEERELIKTSSSSAIANKKQNKNYARNRNAEFFKSLFLHILSLFKVFFFLLDLLNIFKILHKITSCVLHLRGAERGKTEGEHFEMRLYTSSAGRLGMLVFVRVKKAIFSLKTRQRGNQVRSGAS